MVSTFPGYASPWLWNAFLDTSVLKSGFNLNVPAQFPGCVHRVIKLRLSIDTEDIRFQRYRQIRGEPGSCICSKRDARQFSCWSLSMTKPSPLGRAAFIIDGYFWVPLRLYALVCTHRRGTPSIRTSSLFPERAHAAALRYA